jgi:hypothetical protein
MCTILTRKDSEMKTATGIMMAAAVVIGVVGGLIWPFPFPETRDRPADPGTELAAVEQTQETNEERQAEKVRPPIPPWTVVKDSKGRYNYSFASGHVSEQSTFPTAQAAHDAMTRFRTWYNPFEKKPEPSDWEPVDITVEGPVPPSSSEIKNGISTAYAVQGVEAYEDLSSTGTITQMPVSQPGVPLSQLVNAVDYLLAERQEQEALYSAMIERIDQDSDMVIDAIPELEGMAIDDAMFEQIQPGMKGAAPGETAAGPSEVEVVP